MNLKNKIIIGTIALASIFTLYNCNNKDNLKEKDFRDSKWALCENYEALRRAYMGENVPRNKNNYYSYLYYMDYINQGKKIGKTFFPDLDKNGKIIEKVIPIEDTSYVEIEKEPLRWVSGKELFKKIEEQEK